MTPTEQELEARDSMYSEIQEAREIEADREFERLDRGMLP